MCTSGWYPAFVSPVVTVGFILSLYSSAGCKFIDISIGFVPRNIAWNESDMNIGLFFFYDHQQALHDENDYLSVLHEGCSWYTDVFDDAFIQKDRTWKVARVMSLIAIAGSFLASFTCWTIVLFPVPVNCLWSAVVLPAIMLAFIAEGSKFLIFDIALCRNPVWYPSGIDSLPAEAGSCTLGESAYIGIAACLVHLSGLLSVCLRAPEKRRLDPLFGIKSTEKVEDLEQDSNSGKDNDSGNNPYEDDEPSVLDDEIYTPGPSPASVPHVSNENYTKSNVIDTSLNDSMSTGSNDMYSLKQTTASTKFTGESKVHSNEKDSAPLRVSESRLSVLSKMQLNQTSEPSDMIEKLVSDLDSSLQEAP